MDGWINDLHIGECRSLKYVPDSGYISRTCAKEDRRWNETNWSKTL